MIMNRISIPDYHMNKIAIGMLTLPKKKAEIMLMAIGGGTVLVDDIDKTTLEHELSVMGDLGLQVSDKNEDYGKKLKLFCQGNSLFGLLLDNEGLIKLSFE